MSYRNVTSTEDWKHHTEASRQKYQRTYDSAVKALKKLRSVRHVVWALVDSLDARHAAYIADGGSFTAFGGDSYGTKVRVIIKRDAKKKGGK